MILPIVAFGSAVLREKCNDVSIDHLDLEVLLSDMWETMYEASGVGLAAPQINKSISLFLIDTAPFLDDQDSQEEVVKKVFINPRMIEEKGEEWVFNEGCLSIPDIREDINGSRGFST